MPDQFRCSGNLFQKFISIFLLQLKFALDVEVGDKEAAARGLHPPLLPSRLSRVKRVNFTRRSVFQTKLLALREFDILQYIFRVCVFRLCGSETF